MGGINMILVIILVLNGLHPPGGRFFSQSKLCRVFGLLHPLLALGQQLDVAGQERVGQGAGRGGEALCGAQQPLHATP